MTLHSDRRPPDDQGLQRGPVVAYVMSRFPKLTETFVLEEMDAVERSGVHVELYPLIHQRASTWHPTAEPWMARAHYLPFLSLRALCSHVWFIRHRPRAYAAAVIGALAGTWGSANFFLGALGILPKVVHAARLMERDGIEHVHCHFANHPALAGFVVHRLTGIPFSFTAHGSDLHKDRHMLPQKVDAARFVVAISDFNREVALAECGAGVAQKLHVVRCGIDTETFAPPPRHPLGAALRVVTVGTLHEVKGQRHLIDACAQARRAGIDVRCDVVGDGPDRDFLEQRARAWGIANHVRFRGALPQPDVVAALQASHVLIAPSVPTREGKREGIPVVLMEAMSCGLPVIASRLSGIPELIDDGVAGILVNPRDTEGIVAALKRLASDPALRRQMGIAGRARIMRDYNVHTNVSALVGLFQASGR